MTKYRTCSPIETLFFYASFIQISSEVSSLFMDKSQFTKRDLNRKVAPQILVKFILIWHEFVKLTILLIFILLIFIMKYFSKNRFAKKNL
jgi:hypothetical protein